MIIAFFVSLTVAFGSDSKCPNWESLYNSDKAEMADYRRDIEKTFKSFGGGVMPSCPIARAVFEREVGDIRNGEIEVGQIPALKELTKRLPKFKYLVVPPRNEKPKYPHELVILIPGGPGAVLTERPFLNQLDDHPVVIADYVGMGQNSFAIFHPGIDDQFFDLKTYAKLIEAITTREKEKHQMSSHILLGHSFGSVGATMIAYELRSTKLPPIGVLLSGVFDYIRPETTTIARTSARGIEWSPIAKKNKICVLPNKDGCFDDNVLKLLDKNDARKISRKIQKIFKGYTPDAPSAHQAIFRDAFHWETSKTPEKGATFLKNYVLNQKPAHLYCWYLDNFDDVTWFTRNRNPSQIAAVQALNCTSFPDGKNCACFKKIETYSDQFLIPAGRLVYANGSSDTQSPLDGARRHFDSQKLKEKFFVTVCGGGHNLYGESGSPGRLDVNDLVDMAFGREHKDLAASKTCD